MRRSLILDVVLRLVFHSAVLLGCFLVITGHNRPGGGFVGGLVIGGALALRYVFGSVGEFTDAERAAVGVQPDRGRGAVGPGDGLLFDEGVLLDASPTGASWRVGGGFGGGDAVDGEQP